MIWLAVTFNRYYRSQRGFKPSAGGNLQQWRNLEAHRRTQIMGRDVAFANYRLRIAQVGRDYGMNEREQAAPDSRLLHG